MKVSVAGIGLTAPGLARWPEAAPILRGEQPYRETELELTKPRRLPSNERRRTTPLVRLAFQAAEQIAENSPVALQDLALVFGSGGGDTHVIDQICTALFTPARAVSPTQFHNSVHNAAAGYWSIATGATGPSTSLCAYDDTAGAALLEAAALSGEENTPVLYVVCDQRPIPPLLSKRPLVAPFAAALLLLPAGSARDHATLTLAPTDAPESHMADQGLETLRQGNPAARLLPLLRALALSETDPVILPAPGQRIAATLEPA